MHDPNWVTWVQHEYLMALEKTGGATASELAAMTNARDTSVRKVLEELRRQGLVQKAGNLRRTGGNRAAIYELSSPSVLEEVTVKRRRY